MMDIRIKVDTPNSFNETERQAFLSLLIKQGKVQSPSIDRINRCNFIALCFCGATLVSIGAIKPKTVSDFGPEKANLPELEQKFEWELGYFFTEEKYRGNGFSNKIAESLIKNCGAINLMASTETRQDNSMIKILHNNGFKQYGKLWKSQIHNGELGLYLRF